MLEESQLAAVNTINFYAQNGEGMAIALDTMLEYPIGLAIIAYDWKMPHVELATQVFEKYEPQFSGKGRTLMREEVDWSDTTLRWRAGIRRAFKEDHIEAVFVFPGDLAEKPTQQNRDGWERMLGAAGRDVLVLGDYDSRERFKSHFDTLVTYRVIECLYPDLAANVRALGQSKLRSEFFIIGRAVYDHFWKTRFPFGTDPTVELVLSTLQSEDLKVKPVSFGEIADDPGCRHPMGQFEQMFRFVVAPMIARIREEGLREDNLRAYDGARHELESTFDLVLAAVDENREALLEEMELDGN